MTTDQEVDLKSVRETFKRDLEALGEESMNHNIRTILSKGGAPTVSDVVRALDSLTMHVNSTEALQLLEIIEQGGSIDDVSTAVKLRAQDALEARRLLLVFADLMKARKSPGSEAYMWPLLDRFHEPVEWW